MEQMKHISAALRHTAAIIAAAVILLLPSSCTRNNGDIGPWFGTWRLESITVNGEPDKAYAPPYLIWKFQSSIVQIINPDDAGHTASSATGTWSCDDNRLSLDFSWGLGHEGSISHLPPQCELTVLRLSGSRIELRYDSSDGNTYIYLLKKWG